MVDGILKQGFAAQARAMNDFGYSSVTPDQVEAHHREWKAGGKTGADVIKAFNFGAFEQHPAIFGVPDR
jgi:hypothetical protein